MKVSLLVDDDVPGLAEACEDFATVQRYRAAELEAGDERVLEALAAADGLVVRTVTSVDEALLDLGPRLRVVATASAGYDHVDRVALARRSVAFVSAAGSNATAVAEHVITWIAHWLARRDSLRNRPIGVVGFGHTGRRVAARVRALGLDVMVCDPPLSALRSTGDTPSVDEPELDAWAARVPLDPLDVLVRECGIITLHVPLTRDGPHPTRRLIDAEIVRRRPDLVWLNAARGGILDDAALGNGKTTRASLDVFDGEPALDPRLLVSPGPAWPLSPHIAGYSLEAKLRAGAIVAERVAGALGAGPVVPADQRVASRLPSPPPLVEVSLDAEIRCPWEALRAALLTIHDLESVDTQLRCHAADLDRGPKLAAVFAECRRRYTLRREFSAQTVRVACPGLDAGDRDRLLGWLDALGLTDTG